MLCLGIESSCDDTGLALLDDGGLIDSSLASQTEAHAIFGGVVPELASREHGRHVAPLFDALLERNGLCPQAIDVVAVARGPGLLGSLLAGIAFAKGLSLALRRPLIGVNHLHAHLLAAGLGRKLVFPAIGLVASGGHTDLYRLDSPQGIERLGRTLDDAAGEAFDKVGSACGLAYPAGRRIDELAQAGDWRAQELPVPFVKNENLDFSFSGIKTTAMRKAEELGCAQGANAAALPDLCAALNKAVAEALRVKAERALDQNPDARAFYFAGGVAANRMMRSGLLAMARRRGIEMLVPEPQFCKDNGAMIAHAGHLLARAGFRHGLDLEAIPRGRRIPFDAARVAAN